MQSGLARTQHWVLEFEPSARRQIDKLMGWTSSRDTRRQVSLRFDTKEEAIVFAERHGLSYEVFEPRSRKLRARSYADNFSHKRAV